MRTWADIAKASNTDIIAWAGQQPWSEPMRQCRQDSEWHAEGDVWTHTLMVCEQVEKLAEYPLLDRSTQLKLLFTALLHDAGKPATTMLDPETNRLRSPKHSLVGASMTRDLFRSLGGGLEMREDTANLVRYHGRPPYLLDKARPEYEVIGLSCQLSNELLYLFALADSRGRAAINTTRAEETLHLWRDLAMEHECYSSAYPFPNDHARFLFFRKPPESLHYTPHEEYRCTVTLMSGLPGAGKDTWLARHRPGLPVVSLDGLREEMDVDATDNQGAVIQAARERCREHLRASRDFAFNATNITVSLRKKWIDLFADYGARIEVIYLEPSLPVIFRQNREREKSVPESVIRKMLSNLEIPTAAEAHRVTLMEGGESF